MSKLASTHSSPIDKDQFGIRVTARAKELRLKKAQIQRATGATWPTVHAWFKGKQLPANADVLKLLAEALRMSADELLGAAKGQEPTHAVWLAFLETEAGQSMTPDERVELATQVWKSRRPSVSAYQIILAGHRAGDPL